MRQIRRQSIALLGSVMGGIKRWQWFSLFIILSGVVVCGIYRTGLFAGFWGFLDDEIAVVTIESDKDGKQNIIIKDPSKSFWDVLGVLGVPLVLAVLGAWFQKAQQEQSEQIAEEQREQDGDETREEVLQLYFDRVSAILIDKNLMSIVARKNNISVEQKELLEVSTDIIQARTLSILRRFENDSERKSSVIRFLTEADVISRLRISLSRTNLSSAKLSSADLGNVNLSHVDLSNADLSNADLSGANLSGASLSRASLSVATLSGANLSGASLAKADMTGVDLSEANLSGASLAKADMTGVDLSEANLSRTDLSDVSLSFSNLSGVNLNRINLSGASLIRTDLSEASLVDADLSRANLNGANLSGANLISADLSSASLIRTNLSEANLSLTLFRRANLSEANLSNTDLSLAKRLTKKQLEKAKLCDTTLPDGIDLDPNRDCPTSQPSDQSTD